MRRRAVGQASDVGSLGRKGNRVGSSEGLLGIMSLYCIWYTVYYVYVLCNNLHRKNIQALATLEPSVGGIWSPHSTSFLSLIR